MTRTGTALAAFMLAAGLTACGGGSSDFQAKYVEACKKDPSSSSMGDCSCQAGVVDKELNDKEKKVLLTMIAPETDPTKAEQAMKDAGITPEDMTSFAQKMGDLEKKVKDACKK